MADHTRRGARTRPAPAPGRRLPRPAPVPPGLRDRPPRRSRRGQGENVTLANTVGNGIADAELLRTYVPGLIRCHLGEEPVPLDVESRRPDEPGGSDAVLDRLVINQVDGA